MGRPSKYETNVKPFLDDIHDAYQRGVEEKKIAAGLGISVSTWCEYKNKYSELAEALKREEESTKAIIKDLDSALLKSAKGFTYEEKKQYIKKDAATGKEHKYTEITTKYQPPNVTAIFGAYNRFDKDYVKDRAYYDLKQQELELRKQLAAATNFDFDLEE